MHGHVDVVRAGLEGRIEDAVVETRVTCVDDDVNAVQPGKAIFDNFALSTEGLPINRIEQADFFVRQQYLDFLNREPDAEGLTYWLNEIQRCGNDARWYDAAQW